MIALTDLDVYRLAEKLSDMIWDDYDSWPEKAQKTVGIQIIRSADSISANPAEGYGRFTAPDRKKFYRYSRGSFEETKNWLRKCTRRSLISEERSQSYNLITQELGSKTKCIHKCNEVASMKSFKFQISIFIFILLAMWGCTTGDKGNQAEASDEYTCPMHPTIIQDEPGTCPICAMDLVRKGQPGEEVKITAELNYLLKPTNAVVTTSIRTITPERKSMQIEILANGMITYDTRRSTSIPIRFGGRLDKLLIKYNFQLIRKGQKVLEIYSAELVAAQRDLLYLLGADSENTQLINGARERLALLGLSNEQINELEATKKESYSFSVYSPVDGYVIETSASPSINGSESKSAVATSGMPGGMSGGTPNQSGRQSSPGVANELAIREGMYVSAGQGIFSVVNTERVWAEFDLPQKDGGRIKVNDLIKIGVDHSSETIEAKVNFIQPFFKGGENFTKIRVYLPNRSNHFRIGQLVTASFSATTALSMWIPLSAKLDLGTSQVVFVKRRGVFRPKAIVTGIQSGDWIEILSGLETTDSLSYNAQFMVDSEGFIKVKN